MILTQIFYYFQLQIDFFHKPTINVYHFPKGYSLQAADKRKIRDPFLYF